MIERLVFENFLGGMCVSQYLAAKNQYYDGVNMDIITEPGRSAPGYAQTDKTGSELTTSPTKIVAPGISGEEEFVYGYSTTQMFRYDVFNDAMTDNASWVQTITNGDVGGFGVYKGKCYYANGNTQIGSFTPGATPTFTANTITGLTARTYSPMHVFGNILWIGNLNQVASYDGTTVNVNALDLETGYEIDHIDHFGKFLVISAARTTGLSANAAGVMQDAKLFFWDTTSDSWQEEIIVWGEQRIRGMKVVNNTLYVIGANGLYVLDGAILKKIVPFTGTNYSGNSYIGLSSSAVVESLEAWRDFLIWPGLSGTIMFYGTPDSKIPPFISAPVKLSTGNSVYVFGGLDQKLLVSGSSTIRFAKFASGGSGSYNLITSRVDFGGRVKIKGVRPKHKVFASGESIDISVNYDTGNGENAIATSYNFATYGAVRESFVPITQEPAVNNCYFKFAAGGGAKIDPGIEIFFERVETDGQSYSPIKESQ